MIFRKFAGLIFIFYVTVGRLLAIDYGSKRVGLAVTDPDKIIATALETVSAQEAIDFIKQYVSKEDVEKFVIGSPKNLDNTPSQSAPLVASFIKHLKKAFPEIPVQEVDERFTSKIALQTMVMGGYKKKERRKKENLDKISATLILQNYLETIN